MKKILIPLGLLMLLCVFEVRNVPIYTFSDYQYNERYKQIYEELDDSCNFILDYSDPYSLISKAVYSSAAGNIYVTDISDVTENGFEITFTAEGSITDEKATLVSACIPYQDASGVKRLLSSAIQIFPQDEFGAYYSFRTSELSESGNEFAIEVYQKNPGSRLDKQIKIEFYPLYEVSFLLE